MKIQVMAIRDRQLGAYMQPFFTQSTGLGLRAFKDAVNDPKHEMNKHPEDYDLWHLGTFDDQTGTFDQLEDDDRGNYKKAAIALGTNVIEQRQ